MDVITASKVIDRAIILEEGGAIVIPCSSYEEMEKLRVRLYKIRKQMERKHRDLAFSIDITRKVSESKWTLYVTRDTNLSGVFIVEAGEAIPFTLEEETAEEEAKATVIEDFDEVAAKIEATQEVAEQPETSKNNIS